ncbi:MAG TPA: tetratricopeptide repeat protein [Gaiellaceae bacterium]
MGTVEIKLLGGFAALVEGEPVPDGAWRLKKARELVKLLALAPGRRLHREQAMDALWQDRDPAAAANNLHQVVHAARRALGPDSIVVRDELVRLEAEVDLDGFELAAAEARRAGSAGAYRTALALYGGELLPENRYDDWADVRRGELAELHADLAAELARLGPGETLHRLPADVSSFVGRDRELAELRALLGGTRLLTLAGPGGAGKTRLALELARSAATRFEHGVALVELAAVADPRLVPDAAAASLDVRALEGRPLVDALVDFVTPRHLLLVLDNCEHLLGASAALADALLRAAPRLTVVATSREPLRVTGEVVFRVPSLDIPDPDQELAPSELLRYEAVRLLVDRAAAAAPGFELDEENAADVARICFRLDGLPLALELAAARLGALTPAAVAERLDARFRLLRAGSRTAPTRQQTLAATLDWSHDLLELDERILLRRLAIFAGGFELDAAEEVCSSDELEAPEVADVLARLVEKSLVSADDGASGRRYRLLETVRLYARERLVEAGEAPALADREARWVLALVEGGGDGPRLDDEAANLRAALDRLLATEPREALRLCVALWEFWLRRIDLAEARRRFADALTACSERSALRARGLLAAAAIDFRAGTLAPGLAQAEESLAIAVELGDRRAEWRALLFHGSFGMAIDDAPFAALWFEKARDLAWLEGFAAEAALSTYSLAAAQWLLDDLDRAEELVTESVEAFRALARSADGIPAPVNIAETRVADSSGRPRLRLVFEETLQPFVDISCDTALRYVLANQASLLRTRGDLAGARALLDESVDGFAQAGDERGEADVLSRRAYLELAGGSIDAARAEFERVVELRRRVNDRRGLGLALSGLGLVETAAGAYDQAERNLAEARELFRRAGDRWGLASTLWRAADLAFARGRVGDAEAALEEAFVVLSETGRDRWIAYTAVGLAEAATLRRDDERATAMLLEARDRFAAKGDASAVRAVEERLHGGKPPLSRRKGAAGTTSATSTTKRRHT